MKPSPNPRIVRADIPLLQTVISGGQDGVDVHALRAARRLGLGTGGHAPRGWRTCSGPRPQLGTEFGLVESAWDYAGRTKANVQSSDATLRIASDFLSPGERCTLSAIGKFRKPRFDVLVDFPGHGLVDYQCVHCDGMEGAWAIPVHELLRQFLALHKVRILNVAGNRDEDVGMAAEALLVEALS